MQVKDSWVSQAIKSFSCLLGLGLGWFSPCYSSARWRAGALREGQCPCSATHSVFLALFPVGNVLVARDTVVWVWMGVQKGIWGPVLLDRPTTWTSMNPCVCSGTGFWFCLAVKNLVQDARLVSLHVKEHGGLVHKKPCSQRAVGGAGRQTCVSGRRSLKTTFAIWPEKKACLWDGETANMIAMLLERIVISEESKSLSQCALATIGATPGESPVQSQCPYQVLQRYNRGDSTVVGQTFLGSWALNRRAFRKVWNIEYGRERSGWDTPPDYDFCWVFLKFCPSSCTEHLIIWPVRAVCSPKGQKMSETPGHFVKQQKLAITYPLMACPSRTLLSLSVFFHLCADPSFCCPFGGVTSGTWCTRLSVSDVLEGGLWSICWSAGALPAVRMDTGWLMVQARYYFVTCIFTQLDFQELSISLTISSVKRSSKWSTDSEVIPPMLTHRQLCLFPPQLKLCFFLKAT